MIITPTSVKLGPMTDERGVSHPTIFDHVPFKKKKTIFDHAPSQHVRCFINYVEFVSHLFFILLIGDRDHYHLEGLMESPAMDEDGECFPPMVLNATSVNIEVYYNKAVNYTLMVTFVSSISNFVNSLHYQHSVCCVSTP